LPLNRSWRCCQRTFFEVRSQRLLTRGPVSSTVDTTSPRCMHLYIYICSHMIWGCVDQSRINIASLIFEIVRHWYEGLNRSAVGKTGVSFTSRRPQQLAPSNLTSLLACIDALCRAILGHGYARRRARLAPSLRGRPALFPERAPYPFIQSTLKQKLCPSRLRPPRLHPQGRPGLS